MLTSLFQFTVATFFFLSTPTLPTSGRIIGPWEPLARESYFTLLSRSGQFISIIFLFSLLCLVSKISLHSAPFPFYNASCSRVLFLVNGHKTSIAMDTGCWLLVTDKRHPSAAPAVVSRPDSRTPYPMRHGFKKGDKRGLVLVSEKPRRVVCETKKQQ